GDGDVAVRGADVDVASPDPHALLTHEGELAPRGEGDVVGPEHEGAAGVELDAAPRDPDGRTVRADADVELEHAAVVPHLEAGARAVVGEPEGAPGHPRERTELAPAGPGGGGIEEHGASHPRG